MSITDGLRRHWRKVVGVSLTAFFFAWYAKRKKTFKPRVPPKLFVPERYEPGSARQVELFERAAEAAGIPKDWASHPGLIDLIQKESGGWVGIPNYTYGERKRDKSRWPEVWAELRAGKVTTRSGATGLGQLQLYNVDAYYPDKRAGISDAFNEAVGMLKYINVRYGHPYHAARCHDRLCDDIPGKRPKTFKEGY